MQTLNEIRITAETDLNKLIKAAEADGVVILIAKDNEVLTSYEIVNVRGMTSLISATENLKDRISKLLFKHLLEPECQCPNCIAKRKQQDDSNQSVSIH